MSKKEENIQYDDEIFEQEEMTDQIYQEIKKLEFQKNHIKLINTKIGAIKNFKIFARTMQKFAPYLLTAGLVAGGFSLSGSTPFYRDQIKNYSNVKTEFDSDGNIKTQKQYSKFIDEDGNSLDNRDSELSFYSKWQQNQDGSYLRIIENYSLKNKTYEEIMNLLEKEDLNLRDILGKPTSSIKKTKDILTGYELHEDAYFEAIIYDQDLNDYITYKESVGTNALLSLLYVIMASGLEFIPFIYRKVLSTFNYSKCIDDIKRRYQPLDINEISSELESLKEEYVSLYLKK